ncbi:MAG: hypothetical protein NW203_02040, partial [Hyphomonadaceae bacterium]|nr:hypothetical protein [Hyphomonadaceae bacterium]
MNKLLFLGAAGAAGVAGFLSFDAGAPAPAPFIDPVVTARALCGGAQDAGLKRRQLFAAIGAAQAAQTTSDKPSDPLKTPVAGIGYKISTANPR